MAQKEAADGRRVMVLFPNASWRSAALPQSENIWLRATTEESSLKSLSIDTLILVAWDHPDWDVGGAQYAKECLRTSREPRILYLFWGGPKNYKGEY
jgi:hypothetical protein